MAIDLIQRVLHDGEPKKAVEVPNERIKDVIRIAEIEGLTPLDSCYADLHPLCARHFETKRVYHYENSTIILKRSATPNYQKGKDEKSIILSGIKVYPRKARIVSSSQEEVEAAVRYLEERGFSDYMNRD